MLPRDGGKQENNTGAQMRSFTVNAPDLNADFKQASKLQYVSDSKWVFFFLRPSSRS